MNADDRDWFHLRQILRMEADIERRLAKLELHDFAADRDESDLTAFRLQVIGESVRKLSGEFKARYPDLNWTGMIAMRNFIAHNYTGIDVDSIWIAAREHVQVLADVCRLELGDDLP